MRSGIGPAKTPSTDQVLYQSLAAAAMHEIGKKAILDSSLLMFHQQSADVYYRNGHGIPIEVDSEGYYKLRTPEEHEQIRKDVINVVMKFHIFDENGLAKKLDPLINYFQSGEPINQRDANDPFIQAILATHNSYSASIFNQNTRQTLEQIQNFSDMENISEETCQEEILSSYNDGTDDINIAIYEDGWVQCACDYCEGFFQILEKEKTIDKTSLNPIQRIMTHNYSF